ncbi:MAG: hypothetical protein MJ097_00650 [Dorea sp.]|nr:hypothetical protein [Dorea sp.]
MKKKYEIWATFENGMTVKVESHRSERSAQNAIDAMNHHNCIEVANGCGFPYGVPTYSIK